MSRSSFFASIALIFVLFSSSSALAQKFSDVPSQMEEGGNVGLSSAVESLASQGIVGGYSDGTFRPNNPINRAEFLKILLEARYASSGQTIPDCTEKYFSDINPKFQFEVQQGKQ